MQNNSHHPPCDDCGEPTSHYQTSRCHSCAQTILDAIWTADEPDEPGEPALAAAAAPSRTPTLFDQQEFPAPPQDDEYPGPPDLF